jgi:GNAT superfamily N-acetyltransferase
VRTPQLKRAAPAHAIAAVDQGILVRDAPQSHWSFSDGRGKTIGRCSLWWQCTPAFGDHCVGLIGHYAAADSSAARQVLQQACRQLGEQGCTIAISPMDGTTWKQYRLVTQRSPEPTFFLEPDNPTDWPDHFEENGFEPIAHYFSALNDDLRHPEPGVAQVAGRMAMRGVRTRPLQSERFDAELRRIYQVATVVFRNNLLYSPIAEADFVAYYGTLRMIVPPDLVLIAERREQPVGFVFAAPDLLQIQRGQPVDTIIVKSLAVLPDRRLAGLGNLLLTQVQTRAVELGFTRAIYALVRDVPALRRMSGRYAGCIRRYALFAKVLRP